MHEHDLDLVAAFADGTLDSDTDAVEQLVATCQVCREEYRTQIEIGSMLADLPPVAMTEAERNSLRAAVDAALPSPTPDLSPAPAARRESPWWWRVIPVAGAAVVVLGMAGVFLGGISGDSVETFQNVGGELRASNGEDSSATTVAAAEETTTTVEAGVAESIESFSGQSEADEEAEGGGDTAIPPTTVPEDAAGGELPEADTTSRYRAGPVASLDELVSLLTDPTRSEGEFSPEIEFLCIDAASRTPVDGIAGQVEGMEIEVFRLSPDGDEVVLEGFNSPDCTPIDLPG